MHQKIIYVLTISAFLTIDLSKPLQPEIIDEIPLIDGYKMYQDEDRIYVIDDFTCIKTINIENPSNPQLIHSVDFSTSIDYVTVFSKFMYLLVNTAKIAENSKVLIYNNTNPANPILTDSIILPENSNAFIGAYMGILPSENLRSADEAHLFVAVSELLISFSLETPAHPAYQSKLRTPTSQGFSPKDGKTFQEGGLAIYSADQVWFVDVSNPQSLQSGLIMDIQYRPSGTIILADTLHITSTRGVETYISQEDSLTLIHTKAKNLNIQAAAFDDKGYAYTLSGDKSFQIFHISTNSDLIKKVFHLDKFYGRGLSVKKDYLFLIDTNWMKIYNISNPNNPEFKIKVAIDGIHKYARHIPISGDSLYIVNSNGIQIWNISTPTNPVLEEMVSVKSSIRSIDVNNMYMATGHADSLVTYSFKNGSVHKGTVYKNISSVSGCILKGENVYASSSSGLWTANLAEVSVDTLSPVLSDPIRHQMTIAEDLGMVYSYLGYFTFIDLQKPSEAKIAGRVSFNRTRFKFWKFIGENHFITINQSAGIVLYKFLRTTSISQFSSPAKNTAPLFINGWKWHFSGSDAMGRKIE